DARPEDGVTMAIGLLLFVLTAVAVTMLLTRRKPAAAAEGGPPASGNAVRRFFHYLLMLGSLAVAATGLSTLLGRMRETNEGAIDEATLARGVAFTVVGLPLWLALASWALRLVHRSPAESSSVAWAVYFTIAPLAALFILMTSAQLVL